MDVWLIIWRLESGFQMKKANKKWIGVLYAAALVVMAAVGVIYCIMLKNKADAPELRNQYAKEEENKDADANVSLAPEEEADGSVVLDADAEGDIVLGDVQTPAGAPDDDPEQP